MSYTRVLIDALAYELPPIVVTSAELERRLRPAYEKLRLAEGQLEALTGIVERRWWEPGYPVSQGAIAAGRKALKAAEVSSQDVEVLIYAGVCRELFEPATACRVAAGLDISPSAEVFDVSNACLGVLNGMLDIANKIELGQIRAGMVVSCETARDIVEISIQRMNEAKNMDQFKLSVATLTGGSGAAAVLLTDGSFGNRDRRRLLGGVTQTAPEFHPLCRWGVEKLGLDGARQFMSTDSVAVLKHGVALGHRTWEAFLRKLRWTREQVAKIICHQVGAPHRDTILGMLELPADKDFSTFEYLGNIGTVSVPITAALAEERDFLLPGDRVGLLGIGSGLNCLMLGIEW